MPFTISHAAAVLPFARPLARWRLLSAGLIGSMVPDFGLFLPWRPTRVETHSAIGLVTFCLPVGLAVYWVFQRVLKTPVLEVLPNAAYERWRAFASPADIGSLKQWVLAACGVVAGAVTHLVWDGFTHEGARGVRMIPALDDPLVDIAGHHLIGARVLQDVSSLLGLLIVLAVSAYALRRDSRAPVADRFLHARERGLWIFAYVATALLLSVTFLVIKHPLQSLTHSWVVMIGSCAVAALRGFAVALVGVSLCLRLRLSANRPALRADP
jgi:hypothetical protein